VAYRKPIWLQLVFLTFSFYVLMQLVITPDSGEEHLYWPLILRGVGLWLLFVPISTLSLSTLKGKSIGEGAAFTGIAPIRWFFGIAIITTLSLDSIRNIV
jgi:DHA2 family multidrug resistance protein